jgi:outer membrane PBP1 activator LpoA protein
LRTKCPWCSVLLIILVLSVYTTPLATTSSELDDSVIGSLVNRASELYSKGLDVSSVVEKLNRAIVLYEENRPEEAARLVEEAGSILNDMSRVADRVYYTNMALKAVTVTALASIPILVYFLLPRAYLYLWFKSRRKWLVSRW